MARIDRINEQMRSELASLLPSLRDPRLSSGLVSITRVDAATDLSRAVVYFSLLGGDRKEVSRGFRAAAGYIRRELAHRLQLRATPELVFEYDLSIERGSRMIELINSLDISAPDDDSEGKSDENEGNSDE